MCSWGPVVLGHRHPAVRCRGATADGAGRLPERSHRTHGRTG
jgi:glutamate-1-semialdehyde aminotransferase